MENDLLRWFAAMLPAHRQLLLGAGDDAALIQLGEGKCLVATTDMLMEGVDFLLAEHQPERIGRKALAVNLSDLAAMGARPVAALVALSLPIRGGEQLARRLYAGLLPLAEEFGCAIAGGDTNSWSGPLVLSITALGEASTDRAWRRSGAHPGDQILVTGSFGGSILGKHLDFTPRVHEALQLVERGIVRAAIDVSDGLTLDLSRLAEASGIGASLDLDRVPISEAARQLGQQDGRSPLEHALGDGEDFELILAVEPATAQRLLGEQPLAVPLTAIGRFVQQPGLWQSSGNDGILAPLAPQGWQHRLAP